MLFMERGLVFLLLALVMCEFVVGGSYSEIEMNFVVMGVGDVDYDLGFWGEYGDFLVSGLIVLVVIVIYLNAIKAPKRKRKKRRK